MVMTDTTQTRDPSTRTLQLRCGAEAFVCGARLVFRGRSGCKEITFDDASTASRAHDALRSGVAFVELASVIGWQPAAITQLAELLDREGMLAAATLATTRRVALVGLGTLAMTIASRMRAAGLDLVAVLDDMRVEPDETGRFYRGCDVGRLRREVVLDPEGALEGVAVVDALDGIDVDVVLAVLDAPRPMMPLAVLAERIPLVVVEAEAHGVGVARFAAGARAPVVGCPECRRQHLVRRDPFRRHLAEQPPTEPLRWRHRPDAVVGELAVAHAIAMLCTTASDAPEEWFFGERGVLAREPIVRAAGCPRCDRAREGGRDPFAAAATAWRERSRAHATALPLPELASRLRGLTGPRMGLVARVDDRSAAQRAAISAFFAARGVEDTGALDRLCSSGALLPGRERPLHGEGFAFDGDTAAAEALACVEGLERLFALDSFPSGGGFVQCWRALGARAVDPRTLQLYTQAQYETPGFPYRPFDPDAPIRWVVGVRAIDGEPVAVPVDAVTGGALCQATSSGAAAHTSLQLAVLAAVVEAVERDAFMVTWHGELQGPRVPPEEIRDPEGRLAMLAQAGFAISWIDVTTDTGLPVVMQVVRDRRNPDFFMANTASGATLDHAVGKLVRELVQVSVGYMRDPRHMSGPVTHTDDPRAVESLAQHLQFYQRADKHRRCDFLDASTEIAAPRSSWPEVSFDDPHATRVVIDRLHAAGYDPILVDCTPDVLAAVGLVVVRAVIPGLAPLDSGFARRRLGGRRLLEAPRRMGRRDRDLEPGELNPWPHPGA
jgi:ribosomal protein S12 methylthiotransferase accessory factor